MRKTVTICFRTSEELKKSLEAAAKKDNRSVSSTIETIIYEFLKGKQELKASGSERRRYERRTVSIPAFLYESESSEKNFMSGLIVDISLGGMKISIAKDPAVEAYRSGESPQFEALFALPNEVRPVNVRCKTCRVVDTNGDVHVGATFIDSDFNSYQTLQRYLV